MSPIIPIPIGILVEGYVSYNLGCGGAAARRFQVFQFHLMKRQTKPSRKLAVNKFN
jgi:hypothetical protein